MTKPLKDYLIPTASIDGKILDPINILLMKIFKDSPITPNMWTLMHIINSFIICGLFCLGSQVWLIVGALLIQFNRCLDAIDGAIARYKDQKSVRGKYIDLISHAWGTPLYLIGIGVYAFRNTGWEILLYLAFAATIIELVIYATKLSHIRVSGKPYLIPQNVNTKNWLANKLKYPVLVNFDNIIYYLIIIGAIFNIIHWFIPFITLALAGKWTLQFWILSYFDEDKDNDYF